MMRFDREMGDLGLGIAADLLFIEEGSSTAVDTAYYGNDEAAAFHLGGDTFQFDAAAAADLFPVCVAPSDVTGQTSLLQRHMQDDKSKVLRGMEKEQEAVVMPGGEAAAAATAVAMTKTIPPQPSFQPPLIEIEDDDEENEEDLEDLTADQTQSLMDEMEEFIRKYELANATGSTDDLPTVSSSAAATVDGLEMKYLKMEKEEGEQTTVSRSVMPSAGEAGGSECPIMNSTLSDDETKAAEDILDALIRGDLLSGLDQFEEEGDDKATVVQNATADDSGYNSTFYEASSSGSGAGGGLYQPQPQQYANIAEVKTDGGGNVIIILTREAEQQQQQQQEAAATAQLQQQQLPQPLAALAQSDYYTSAYVAATEPFSLPPPPPLLSSSAMTEEDDCQSHASSSFSTSATATSSDSEWSPPSEATTRKKPGRKPYERRCLAKISKAVKGRRPAGRPYATAASTYQSAAGAIKDKKERKKMQNVEAARRYRDKKKLEQEVIESELQLESGRNTTLKSKLAETQSEFNTLKKLMVDLGLVKKMDQAAA